MQNPTNIECPIEKSISLIGSKWSLLIIRLLYVQKVPMRFNEMLRSLKPISTKTLTQKLKELQNFEVIERKVQDSTPVLITYELTERGKELRGVMDSMAQWSLKWNMKKELD